MVDCMNQAGIDFVCFGNHENDLKWNQLTDRIKESKFVWINSNIDGLPSISGVSIPKYFILEAKSSAQSRRIALTGIWLYTLKSRVDIFLSVYSFGRICHP